MQFLRSITWRLLGVLFLVLFLCAFFAPESMGGAATAIPQSAVLWTAGAFLLAMMTKPSFIHTSETLSHEVGHALISANLGGQVRRIAVMRDTNGVTQSRKSLGRLRSALVSISGPLASPVFFLFTSLMVTANLPHVWLTFVLAGVVLVVITTVRNLWGWIVGAVAVAILWQVLQSSLSVGSSPSDWQLPAVWSTSSINAAALLTAFNAGVALRYSWGCRRGKSPGSDEHKFGHALGIGPALGGRFILLANAAFSAAGFLILNGIAFSSN